MAQCSVCGTALNALNHAIGTSKCAGCARGVSAAAINQRERTYFDAHADVTEASIAARSPYAAFPRLFVGALLLMMVTPFLLGILLAFLGERSWTIASAIAFSAGMYLANLLVTRSAHPLDARRWRVFASGFSITMASLVVMAVVAEHLLDAMGALLYALPIAPVLVGFAFVVIRDTGLKRDVVDSLRAWQAWRAHADAQARAHAAAVAYEQAKQAYAQAQRAYTQAPAYAAPSHIIR